MIDLAVQVSFSDSVLDVSVRAERATRVEKMDLKFRDTLLVRVCVYIYI